jgi:predicted SAM-dependent methyltransferase
MKLAQGLFKPVFKSFAEGVLSFLHLETIFSRVLFALRLKTPVWPWSSETSKCRSRLAPFCIGYGVDIGFGGEPIVEHAIRIDLPEPYAKVGNQPVQLGGDAANLHWFRDRVLDFVYSSHLLEDFSDTEAILCEWLRVIKPGGKLILYCPDEQRFREHCEKTGQPYNLHHRIKNFSFAYVKELLERLGENDFVHENPHVDDYSWELVLIKKQKLRES